MSSTMYVTEIVAKLTCPKCGGVYAISQAYLTKAHELGDFKQCWRCPYARCNNERGYGESELDIARKRAAKAERLQNEIHNKWEPLTGYERAAAFEEAAKVAENADFMSYAPHDHPERIAAAIRKHAEETTT